MQHWNLATLDHSTDKQHPREPGSDAPRVESTGTPKPQVLFSYPECRAVLLHLAAGERMDDHSVRERAVVEVVSGRVSFELDGETQDCPAGTLLCFEPGERHAVQAHEDARMLLLLTPWSSSEHAHFPEHVPRNATVDGE